MTLNHSEDRNSRKREIRNVVGPRSLPDRALTFLVGSMHFHHRIIMKRFSQKGDRIEFSLRECELECGVIGSLRHVEQ
jgi:hypothetical protein